jgi:hypothetical protein
MQQQATVSHKKSNMGENNDEEAQFRKLHGCFVM